MASEPVTIQYSADHPKGSAFIIIPCLLAAGTGLLALSGWILGQPILSSLGANLIPMAPSTAALLLLFAHGIARSSVGTLSRRLWIECTVIGVVETALASILAIGSVAGVRSPVEHLGFKVIDTVGGVPMGHISPMTALCFVVAGASFLLSLNARNGRAAYAKVALVFAGLLLAFCVVVLVSYLLGSPLFYGGTLIPPAATSVLGLAALGTALWTLAYQKIAARRVMRDATLGTRGGFTLVLTFCLLAIAIFSIGALYYRSYRQQFRQEIEQQLTAVAEMKANELMHWREERLGNAGIEFRNPFLSALVKRFLSQSNDTESSRDLQLWLEKIRTSYKYDRVFLLDTEGRERLAAPEGLEPVAAHLARDASEALRSGQVMFLDFHRRASGQPIHLGILIPIFDAADGNQALGVLVLRANAESYLGPLIKRWPNASKTAESLLIRQDGNDALILNELNYSPSDALSIRFPLEKNGLLAKVIRGQRGVVEDIDHRGVPVLAELRVVPRSPWFFVTKVDLAEVDAPLRARLWLTLFFVSVILMSAGIGVGMLWRQQRMRFLGELLDSERKTTEAFGLLHALVEATPDVIYAKDNKGLYLLINAAASKITGKTAEDVLGKDDQVVLPPDYAQKVMRGDLEVMQGGKLKTFEDHILHADGSLHTYHINKGPIFDGAGVVCGLFGIGRDITERKQAELMLLESEERYRTLFNSMTEGFALHQLVYDEQGQPCDYLFLNVNPAFESITGLERGKLIGRRQRDVIPGEEAFWLKTYAKVAMTGESVHLEHYSPPLGKHFGVFAYRPAPNQFAVIFTDITKRKQAEAEAQIQARRLTLATDAAMIGIWDWDVKTNQWYATPTYFTMLGYEPEPGFSQTECWVDRLHPDDRVRVGAKIAAALDGRDEPYEYEARMRNADGEYRWISVVGRVLERDEQGKPSRMLGVRTDITERKKAEAAREAMAKVIDRKNQELEQMVYVTSHDLRSPLLNIQGFSRRLNQACEQLTKAATSSDWNEALRQEFTEITERQMPRSLNFIQASVEKIDRLLDGLLRLSRLGRAIMSPEQLDLNLMIGSICSSMAYQIQAAGAVVETESLGPCSGDATLLNQLFTNLIDNAIKYRDPARPLKVSISGRRESDRLICCVADNGQGIAQPHLERIWELFYRVNPNGPVSGEGLGLSLVRRIVERHGGEISVVSTLGEGTRITFSLSTVTQF